MLSSACDKAKLFAKNFSKNSNLDDSYIFLPVFPSRTNLQQHNISITPIMVQKIITNLDLSQASGPDCIPVMVLKNCEPELSYILAELFSKCQKGSCFQDCLKVSPLVPVLKNVGESLQLKSTILLVFFLWLVKSFKILKVVSATFEFITMFKQKSLSFHVVSKTFITQNYLFVIPKNILQNTILKHNIVATIILMTYTNALKRTRSY